MNRRTAVFSFLVATSALVASRSGRSAAFPKVAVYRNPGCSCCEGWVKYMRTTGFQVSIEDDADLDARRASLRIPAELASCHIALADGYAFEGHIPPVDIVKFLNERPVGAFGLVVPGMPLGSPGMGVEGSGESYDVFLLKTNAVPTVYASH
jgi:hypothetical protein